jgi:hypothetical protein
MKLCSLLTVIFAVAFSLTSAYSNTAHAGWSHDPAVNTVVSADPGIQETEPAIISDGSGGAIIAWMHGDIYVQRVDAYGNAMWGANGVALSSGGSKYHPRLAGDGDGGAFITWQVGGDGSGGIYVQRVDANGNALWTLGGEIICNAAGNHQYPQIVGDGNSGAIIAWQDSRNGEQNYDIYAQRVHSDGDGDLEELWAANGAEICIAAGHQYYPQLIPDGSGGAIITWQDGRNSGDTGWDIYAQNIDGDGNILWTVGGNPVCEVSYHQEKPQIVSDGSFGAIITWQDGRTPANGYDVYAQRLDGNGEALWTGDGEAVSTGTNNQQDPQIVSDGSHGAVIAWWGIVNGGNPYGIYAQRINGSGTAQWSGGVTVATPSNIDTNYYSPQIAGDGNHGAVITWADQRNGSDYNVYAQRVRGTDGAALWTSDGSAVSTAANHQQLPRLIAADSGGAIITWQDLRSGDWDIYAQKVLGDGTLHDTPTVTTATPVDTTATTASSGGEVTSDGGAPVTARGVCWSTSAGPTITGSHTSDGSGTGAFSSSITGLTPSTPYHVRAYATNSVGTSYGSDLQFTTLAGSTLTVNLTGVGGGGGRVTSDQWGIDCTFGQCSAFFTTGSQVTLTATPNGDSLFGIWGGDCDVTDGKCVVTMNGTTKNVTASFNYVQTVRILGSATPYTLIGGAYAGLPNGGGTIQARVHEFTETLNFNRSISAIIKGGYDTAYNGNSGLTTVKGTVTVTNGSVTVENLAIR